MNVLLENIFFYPKQGGVETYLYNVSRELLRLGHTPIILCSKHAPSLPKEEIINGIRIIRFSKSEVWPKKEIKRIKPFLKKLIKKEKIDVALCHFSAWLLPTAKLCPTIFIQHGVTQAFFSWIRNYRKETPLLKKVGIQLSELEKKGMKKCVSIVTLSKMVLQKSIDFYNIPKEKYKQILPGVDFKRFKKRKKDTKLLRELGLNKNRRIILSIARLAVEKNLTHLIKSFSLIKNRSVSLVIVGEGPEKRKLKRFVKRLGIHKKVIFTGKREDVERFYSIADLFVLPSRYETFGLAYLEAMASGVPCIALRSDYPEVMVATNEIIKENKTGFLVNHNSIDELAEKIQFILNSNSGKHMGITAEKEAEKYSWTKCTRELLTQIKNGPFSLSNNPRIQR